MTLEAFARAHKLPPRWLDLRKACESIVRRPDFWYRRDLQERAKKLAVEASEMLAGSATARAASDQARTKERTRCQG
jgi:hypothetical protein